MFKSFKDKLVNWTLEIILVLFTTIISFIWGIHITNADQQIQIEVNKVKIISLEEKIESFRKENREDHKEIMMELKRKT